MVVKSKAQGNVSPLRGFIPIILVPQAACLSEATCLGFNNLRLSEATINSYLSGTPTLRGGEIQSTG